MSALQVLCVGRLVPEKGQHVLLDAAAAAGDVRVVFVGDGPSRASLERHAAALGVDAVFTGSVGQDEIRDHYRRADAFCLASFAEGVPVVLMEAMAMELPVVTTRIAGIPELVTDGTSGLVVPPGRADLLAEALRALAGDPQLRRRLGAAGREAVAERYDLHRSAAELNRLFGSRLGPTLPRSMRTVTLQPTAVETTVLGFGCAGLMRHPSRRDRDAVLGAAWDAGIRHFDTARMYGLGAAERELGRFLGARRDEAVIATKFGIDPGRGGGPLARLQAPARWLLQRYPQLRARVKKAADEQIAFNFDPAHARESLETSLRELGTDRVDLFLLHGPSAEQVRTEEICAFLEDARGRGQVRAWGVSTGADSAVALTRSFGVPTVLQVHDDILMQATRDLPGDHVPVTYGVLARPLELLREHLDGDPARLRRWSDEVGLDCASQSVRAELLLRDAVQRNPTGPVIFASGRPAHVAAGVRAAAQPPDASLEAFQRLAAAELTAP
jgi:diketogulonate reductase-like aldo/keto reductase